MASLCGSDPRLRLHGDRTGILWHLSRCTDENRVISAISVAEQAIDSAQEAFRVTDAQLQAGTATATDLLEAQPALTQARLNHLRAQCELAIARASLRRSLGR
jgi:outer membrane protein TolC